MSMWTIIAIGLAYGFIAIDLAFFKGNTPLAIVFGGYAFSNVGLALAIVNT